MQFCTAPQLSGRSLPDKETLELRIPDGSNRDSESYHPEDFEDALGYPLKTGWYWRGLGVLVTDTEFLPVGPFATENDAIRHARG